MPKVYLSDSDRALARFRRWYHDTKPSRDVTDSKVARALGVSQPNVSMKMSIKKKKNTEITLRDAMLILQAMNATDEEIIHLMRLKGR